MRLVDRPVMKPMHCAAIPHRGQTAEGERWVDTGAEMPGFDNHVYLSETAVREAGRLLGFPNAEEAIQTEERARLAELRLGEAEAQIAYLRNLLESTAIIERYLESFTEPEPEIVIIRPEQPVTKQEGKPNGTA